jgi:Tfp pilus assembly protein PilF
MQGKLDEALASFESVIEQRPESIEARIRAAELYSRQKGNHLGRRSYSAKSSAFRRLRRVTTCTLRTG